MKCPKCKKEELMIDISGTFLGIDTTWWCPSCGKEYRKWQLKGVNGL